jgi:hypothetical protein
LDESREVEKFDFSKDFVIGEKTNRIDSIPKKFYKLRKNTLFWY